jgi:hypothetical protein
VAERQVLLPGSLRALALGPVLWVLLRSLALRGDEYRLPGNESPAGELEVLCSDCRDYVRPKVVTVRGFGDRQVCPINDQHMLA